MKSNILLFSLFFASMSQARTWTEAATGRTVEADFVKVDGATVVIRLANGSTSQLPVSRLGDADQAFLKLQSPAPPASASAAEPVPSSATTGNKGSGKGDVQKQLLGTWTGYMADSDGSRHGDIQLEITEERITASNPQGNRAMGAGTYKVSGRRIDATGTEGQFSGRKYEGIFEIDGKTLRWCSANDNPRSKRPDRMQTNTQAGQFLMVLEKER